MNHHADLLRDLQRLDGPLADDNSIGGYSGGNRQYNQKNEAPGMGYRIVGTSPLRSGPVLSMDCYGEAVSRSNS